MSYKIKRKRRPVAKKPNPITAELDNTWRRIVEDIQRIIERIAAHHHRRVDRVFEDWLQMLDASLTMFPSHAASIAQTGKPAEDPPEIKDLFARIRVTYPHLDPEANFPKATGILLESAEIGYFDVIGTVYMAINAANKYTAQYFTPWPVAEAMAMLAVGEHGPALVIERLLAAADAAANAPGASAGLKASRLMGRLSTLRDNLALYRVDFPAETDVPDWLPEYWTEIAPHYEPVDVLDPAIGSGVMMLAAASLFPRWMLYLGLVRFYGQDVDRNCILMARINAKLYGLNGFGGEMIRALASGQEGGSNDNPQVTLIAPPGTQTGV